jgi:hypothetical protein
LYCLCTTYGFRLVIVLSLYFLRLSLGHCIVSVLLTTFAWLLYCLCTTHRFRLVIVLSLFYLRFRLVIVLSLYYLRLSFVHCIFSVLLTAAVCHCFVSVLLTALIWSLNCLCNTHGFPLVIVLSLCYLQF